MEPETYLPVTPLRYPLCDPAGLVRLDMHWSNKIMQ